MNPIYKFQLSAIDEARPINYYYEQPQIARYNGKYLLKADGTLANSTVNYVVEFAITDTTKKYYASGRVGSYTTACFIAYYTSNGNFISYEFASTGTARVFDRQLLTIPANCGRIRVQGYDNGNGTVYLAQLFVGESRAFPIYKDDLAKDFEKESGQEFFRTKLSGGLTFQSNDYTYIVSQAFDTQFVFDIFISYNAGQSWESYWRGTFWKTDCDFDDDAKTVSVNPTVWDQYNDVLAGMDKEYNLIELAPEIVPVKADKRPMIQVYVPGQSVIGCFLSGMWWEQECEPESDEDKLSEIGDGKLNFALNKVMTVIDVSGLMLPQLPNLFSKAFDGRERFNPRTQGTTEFTATGYKLVYYYSVTAGSSVYRWTVVRVSDNITLWQYQVNNNIPPESFTQITLTPVSGSGATGNVTLFFHDLPVYSRFVLNTPQISGLDTYPIPADDIVENNRNYTRVIGYYFPDTIYFSTSLTSTPNQWGLYQPGQYYEPPYLYWLPELFPVARNAWGRVSIWFTFSAFDWIVEESGRQQFTIRHAYPLASVISVLLAKIAPGITHEATTDYSQFLYGQNLIGITQTLLITPKSNIVTAGYDQPAQKAPITLKDVLDMLRDCFRCYWFIDSVGRFRIEHIQYFRNGGSYSESPVIGINLVTQKVTRNNKAWAFARNQYKFDKPGMAARYQFGWMDDVTQLFEGFPIDIISKYVNPENIEQITVSRFTSDIDYCLLNPGEISKDGFVLLASTPVTWQETLNQSEVYSWNGGAIQTLSLQAYRGKTMRITVNTSSAYLSVSQGGTDFSALIGEIDNEPNTNKTFEFIVDQNADYIYLYIPQSGGVAISSLQYMDGEYKLPYLNYNPDGNDHYLQNAYVAFCVLQQYYAFDMPAPLYSINGEQKQAQGIKKLKNQTLRFPVLNDPDMVQLVKTNLGNGTIEKISVNLSSRNANATLKYDTE